MHITTGMIVTAGAITSALLLMGGVVFRIYRWYLHQAQQDRAVQALKLHHEADLKRINEENTLICYALSACLDGLIQLGANHEVPRAKEKLDKYLNRQAHK